MQHLKRRRAHVRRVGKVDIVDPTLVLSDPAELAKTLLTQFRNPSYDPPRLPEVATRLLELDKRADVDTRTVVELLEQDSLLSGRILRLVRSPLYAGRMPIRSLRNAVIRLGLATVRNTVMEVVLQMRILRAPEPLTSSMRALSLHLRATAHAARTIARRTSFDAEHAFLCGLLHDIGSVAALTTIAEALPAGRSIPSFALLWSGIDEIHARASERIGKLWDLAPDVNQVIGAHHSLTIGGHEHPLAAVICLAEHLASTFGAPACDMKHPDGQFRFDQSRPTVLDRSTELLSFSDAQLQSLLEEVQRVVQLVIEDDRSARHAA